MIDLPDGKRPIAKHLNRFALCVKRDKPQSGGLVPPGRWRLVHEQTDPPEMLSTLMAALDHAPGCLPLFLPWPGRASTLQLVVWYDSEKGLIVDIRTIYESQAGRPAFGPLEVMTV
jgi:hypothetical protein